jgi:hypothetical protein
MPPRSVGCTFSLPDASRLVTTLATRFVRAAAASIRRRTGASVPALACPARPQVRSGRQRWVAASGDVRRCDFCGREFVPRAAHQRFCRWVCQRRGRRPEERLLYDANHVRLRRQLEPTVAAGKTVCPVCGVPILRGEPWDLGHADGPGSYLGPLHRRCNRNTMRKESPGGSRKW